MELLKLRFYEDCFAGGGTGQGQSARARAARNLEAKAIEILGLEGIDFEDNEQLVRAKESIDKLLDNTKTALVDESSARSLIARARAFSSKIEVEGGSFTVEADMPSKLGGWGTKPGPIHYCLYGLASCYAFTFAALAAMEGVTLRKLEMEAEGNIDVSKVLGISENPIVEEVKWKVIVDSDADEEKIERLKRLAEERCPAVYCLTNPVKLTIDLVRG